MSSLEGRNTSIKNIEIRVLYYYFIYIYIRIKHIFLKLRRTKARVQVSEGVKNSILCRASFLYDERCTYHYDMIILIKYDSRIKNKISHTTFIHYILTLKIIVGITIIINIHIISSATNITRG